MFIIWYNFLPVNAPPWIYYLLAFIGMAVLVRILIETFFKNEIVLRISDSCLVVSWLLLIGVYTLAGREIGETGNVQLEPFWCIREAWSEADQRFWYMVIGNIALFMPLGIFVSMLLRGRWKARGAIVSGFVVSLLIETIQLMTHRGLFELDDIINNTLGCYLGYCIWIIIAYIGNRNRHKLDISKRRYIASVIALCIVVGFFACAIMLGQPVLGQIIR